jgi:hypothetical protein
LLIYLFCARYRKIPRDTLIVIVMYCPPSKLTYRHISQFSFSFPFDGILIEEREPKTLEPYISFRDHHSILII